jgi:hypothetical protein
LGWILAREEEDVSIVTDAESTTTYEVRNEARNPNIILVQSLAQSTSSKLTDGSTIIDEFGRVSILGKSSKEKPTSFSIDTFGFVISEGWGCCSTDSKEG